MILWVLDAVAKHSLISASDVHGACKSYLGDLCMFEEHEFHMTFFLVGLANVLKTLIPFWVKLLMICLIVLSLYYFKKFLKVFVSFSTYAAYELRDHISEILCYGVHFVMMCVVGPNHIISYITIRLYVDRRYLAMGIIMVVGLVFNIDYMDAGSLMKVLIAKRVFVGSSWLNFQLMTSLAGYCYTFIKWFYH